MSKLAANILGGCMEKEFLEAQVTSLDFEEHKNDVG